MCHRGARGRLCSAEVAAAAGGAGLTDSGLPRTVLPTGPCCLLLPDCVTAALGGGAACKQQALHICRAISLSLRSKLRQVANKSHLGGGLWSALGLGACAAHGDAQGGGLFQEPACKAPSSTLGSSGEPAFREVQHFVAPKNLAVHACGSARVAFDHAWAAGSLAYSPITFNLFAGIRHGRASPDIHHGAPAGSAPLERRLARSAQRTAHG